MYNDIKDDLCHMAIFLKEDFSFQLKNSQQSLKS